MRPHSPNVPLPGSILCYVITKRSHMKQTLTLIACLIGLISHAQYFEGRYGTGMPDNVGTGTFTQASGSGHLVAGQRYNSLASELILVRTDASGLVPATMFNNRYKMYDSPALNVNYNVLQSVAVELDANTYGVVGTCDKIDPTNPAQGAIYFTRFALNGTVLSSFTYQVTLPALTYDIRGARLSPNGTALYVAGMVTEAAQSYAVVMKLNIATSAIIWARSYMVDPSVASGEPECAFDLVENTVINELLVVGFRHVCTNTSDDGWMMRLDPTNGNPVGNTQFFGDPNASDKFTSIELMDNGNGFYIGGWSGITTGSDPDNWTLSFDNNFNINWSTVHDYDNSVVPNYGYDIREYTDADGGVVLFSQGYTDAGRFGQSDIEVYEINTGNGAAMSQITYGTSRREYGYSMDRNMGPGGGPGIAVYGQRDDVTTSNDLIVTKAMFDGSTPCNYREDQIQSRVGPDFLYDVEPGLVHYFSAHANHVAISGQLNRQICTGSDGLAPQGGASVPEVELVQPAAGTDCQLLVKTEETQVFTIELRDLKGSVLKVFAAQRVEAGEAVLDLDLSGLGLSSGMYLIHWSDGIRSGGEKVVVR